MSLTQEQRNQFFATVSRTPTRVKIGGKFSFAKLPQNVKEKVQNRLAEKDEVMKKGQKGIFPGIKIDGKQLTKENLHKFEIKPKNDKVIKKKEEPKKEMTEKEFKNYLNSLSFNELKKIAKKHGETGRSKKGIIKDILKHFK